MPRWSGPPGCRRRRTGLGLQIAAEGCGEEWCGGGEDLGAAELAAEGRRGEGSEAAEEGRRPRGR